MSESALDGIVVAAESLKAVSQLHSYLPQRLILSVFNLSRDWPSSVSLRDRSTKRVLPHHLRKSNLVALSKVLKTFQYQEPTQLYRGAHVIPHIVILNAYSSVPVINTYTIRPEKKSTVSNRASLRVSRGPYLHLWEVADWVSSKDFLVVLAVSRLVGCSGTTPLEVVRCRFLCL